MTTDITELAQREKFEAWARSQQLSLAYGDCGYFYSSTEMAWRAVKALSAELVDALEKALKSNEFLKGQLSELANFNPDWDKLEASYESWREIAAELLVAKELIADLESRSVKLPLPRRKTADDYVDDTFEPCDLAAVYNACRLECEVKFKNALTAVGIKWEAE
ncbi:hypothetical protein [Klebsiella oxytoca]|uniref:hypothetical protein n=1 Tax=Klebsiella oxytoca TaxID=571 RepID=UPI00190E6AC4|nr:hypothetical protein [Klebsiella oxytoca]